MTVEELIAVTTTEAGSSDPLNQLARAARKQQQLAHLGEQLLDHFVQQARNAGCSWSQIGAALGISKQAVQQRHSGLRGLLAKFRVRVGDATVGMFQRFTAPARTAVVLAQEEARRLKHPHIGTEHLLLGLLSEGEGIAAQALRKAGLDEEGVRTEVEAVVGPGCDEQKGHIPFTPRTKRALELSLQEALKLHHNYLGTEHVLLGIIAEGEGLAMQVLAAHGVAPEQLRGTVLSLLERGEGVAIERPCEAGSCQKDWA